MDYGCYLILELGIEDREDWLPREDVEVYIETIGNGVDVPQFA